MIFEACVILATVVIGAVAVGLIWDRRSSIPPVDMETLYFLAGIAALGAGLWLYRPWVSLVVVGTIFILLSFLPVIFRAIGD